MVRALLIVGFLVLVAGSCDDSSGTSPDPQNGTDGPPVTPVARPASVSPEAEELQEETNFGTIERSAGSEPEGIDTRRLLTAECQSDVMVIFTDREIIHAALPCDRFWDDDTRRAFSGQQVAMRMTVDATRFQIFVETLDGAQAEFTVEGIWIE